MNGNRIILKCGSATVVVMFMALMVQAQECWLEPLKFRYKAGEEIKVEVRWGKDFEGELLDISKNKTEKVELNRLSGVKEVLKEVKSSKGSYFTYRASQDGTHVLTLQNNVVGSGMTGSAFNEYLEEHGLDNILNERKKLNQLEKPAREFISCYAKTLIQAGEKTDDTFKKKTGHRVEIIPDQNPYTLKTGDYLLCRIFFDGKPVPHTLVKVWSRIATTTFLQSIYTESDGSIRFPISTSGTWMVSSVMMIKAEKEGADYQSLWASLIFGI